jgi:hypothetical protein
VSASDFVRSLEKERPGNMKEDELAIDGGLPILIPPGEYDARIIGIHKLRKFNRTMFQIRFEIVSMDKFNGTRLEAWLPVGNEGRLAKGSKLVRWYLTLEEWGRKDRVSLRAFQNRLLRVRVRTVEIDYRQVPLPKSRQYSVVDDLLANIGQVQTANEKVNK